MNTTTSEATRTTEDAAEDLRATVRDKYGKAAQQAAAGERANCGPASDAAADDAVIAGLKDNVAGGDAVAGFGLDFDVVGLDSFSEIPEIGEATADDALALTVFKKLVGGDGGRR